MTKYAGMIWKFKGQWNKVESECGIDIYEGQADQAGCLVVICKQLRTEGCGVSVTNAAEQIATEVLLTRVHEWCLALPADKRISPNNIVWIEYYPQEDRSVTGKARVDRVTFAIEIEYIPSVIKGLTFAHPKWHRLDRETVEKWIGGAF